MKVLIALGACLAIANAGLLPHNKGYNSHQNPMGEILYDFSKPIFVKSPYVAPTTPAPKRSNSHLAAEPFMKLESFSAPQPAIKNDRYYLPASNSAPAPTLGPYSAPQESYLGPLNPERYYGNSQNYDRTYLAPTLNSYSAPAPLKTVEQFFSAPAQYYTPENTQGHYSAPSAQGERSHYPQDSHLAHGAVSSEGKVNSYLAPVQAQTFEKSQSVPAPTVGSYLPPSSIVSAIQSYLVPEVIKAVERPFPAPAQAERRHQSARTTSPPLSAYSTHLAAAPTKTSHKNQATKANPEISYAPAPVGANSYLPPAPTKTHRTRTTPAPIVESSYLPPASTKSHRSRTTPAPIVESSYLPPAPSRRRKIRTTTVAPIVNNSYLPAAPKEVYPTPKTVDPAPSVKTQEAQGQKESVQIEISNEKLFTPIVEGPYSPPAPTKTYHSSPASKTSQHTPSQTSYLPPTPTDNSDEKTALIEDVSYLPPTSTKTYYSSPAPSKTSYSSPAPSKTSYSSPAPSKTSYSSHVPTKTSYSSHQAALASYLAPAPTENADDKSAPIEDVSYLPPAPTKSSYSSSASSQTSYSSPAPSKSSYSSPAPSKTPYSSHAPTKTSYSSHQAALTSYLSPAPTENVDEKLSTPIDDDSYLPPAPTKTYYSQPAPSKSSYSSPAPSKTFYSSAEPTRTSYSSQPIKTSYSSAEPTRTSYSSQPIKTSYSSAEHTRTSYSPHAPSQTSYLPPAPSKTSYLPPKSIDDLSVPTKTIHKTYLAAASSKDETLYSSPTENLSYVRHTNLSPSEINTAITALHPAEYETGNSNRNDAVLLRDTLQDKTGKEGYEYQYELSDGQEKKETGRIVHDDEKNGAIAVKGSYSWVDLKTNKKYTVNYVADEHGFHAQGDHIPRS